MTILYADDDSDDRELLSEAIKEVDPAITCVTVCDGKEALDVLEHTVVLPDFIFLDINMPVMNGKECLAAIRKSARYKDLPVVIYSTTTDDNEKKYYNEKGVTFISKPSSFVKLCSVLAQFLSLQQGRQSLCE